MSKKRKKMDFSKLSKNVDFKQALESQEVLYGIITATVSASKFNEEALTVEIDGKKTVLLKREAGYLPKNEPLIHLVGKIMSFVVISHDEETGVTYVSHKKASKILAEPLLKKMKEEGEVVEVIVRRLEPFGAYVTICEGVYGIIKNDDATSDLGTAQSALQLNQKVLAKYKTTNPSGQIYLELAEKIEHDKLIGTELEELEVGECVLGRVEKILKTGVIVKSSKNTTILTSARNMDIYIGQHVSVKIKSVGDAPKGSIYTLLD